MASTEQVAVASSLLETLILSSPARFKEAFGMDPPPPLPKFHEEYPKRAGWPRGVDVAGSRKYLWEAYEHARLHPWMFEIMMSNDKYSPSPGDVLKRLNGAVRLSWYTDSSRRPYDLCPPIRDLTSGSVPAYDSRISHAFGNQAYRTDALVRGTAHVAAGFVDMGILLAAKLQDDGTKSGPLRFVGFERSAYAVAKTLAIWEMIAGLEEPSNSSALARAVLQVWFSTTWTRRTSSLFQAATRSALRRRGGTCGDVVRGLLEHWSDSRGVTLRRARSQWLHQRPGGADRSRIAKFTQLRDRLAAATYELTGSVGVVSGGGVGDSADLVGSITFFDNPDGTPPLADVETVFETIPAHRQVEAATARDSTVFDAIEALHLENIEKLIRWGRSGDVVVELHHKAVEDAVAQIAALHPWTMSWSNILDYVDPRDFHELARACSIAGDTIHFAYSMNWITEVYGTMIFDYPTEVRKKLLVGTREAIDKIFKTKPPGCEFRFHDRFRLPIPGNPINTTAWILAQQYFRPWLRRWFGYARESGDGSWKVGNAELCVLNPASKHGDLTTHFTWTYDLDVAFHALYGTVDHAGGDPLADPA
mmetsp:Transcript_9880/g.32190  ORF Transcript_9880/g.32190 Transcript_9880/m.32190 type:complete len:591 (+) Transcript_9880:1804-3576(+)